MKWILLLALTFNSSLTCAFAQTDEEIQAAVLKALSAYSLTSIHASVQKRSVSLTGSVNLCRDRLLAYETVSRIHGVKAIQDGIEVSGPLVPDAQLKPQIHKIIADRIRKLGDFGVGSITARVHNGAVTLSGAAAPELAAPAINAIAGVVGVKNVIDHVLPFPIMRKPGDRISQALLA